MIRRPGACAAVLLSIVLLTSCGKGEPPPRERAPAETASHDGVIVALGDSLTAGLGVNDDEAWPALLEERLRAGGLPWKVVNAGISGETSSGARARIGWILKLSPDVVIVETGANDGLRGIPVAVLRENLDAILAELKTAGVTVVIAGMRMVTNLGAEYTAEFAGVYPHLAEKHRVPLIPFILEGVAGEPALNQADGIHPTADGHRIMAETVYPAVVRAIGQAEER